MIIGSITEIPYSSSYRAIQADKTAQTEETVPTEPLTETIAEDEKEKKNADKLRGENGVLRLLQEGHFKPNAEMRLREIFHRELSILREQNQPAEVPLPEVIP
ncbi:MAG: hypothetical protein ABIE92_12650 [bacterium]